jgi:ORF6N domain
MKNRLLIPIERVNLSILSIRNERVILDADLALLYGVTTKRLNEQVKRNQNRFPEDFMFQLTKTEKDEVVANCDHLQNLKFSRTRPYAFTEHGAIMAANILNSDRAVEASVQIVRAFVRLRNLVSTHKEIAAQLAKLESHLAQHDDEIEVIFAAIRGLMAARLPRETLPNARRFSGASIPLSLIR